MVVEGLESSLSVTRRFIRGIRGIKVVGAEIELKWRGPDSLSLRAS